MKNKGFTLIEVIIYIVLFSLMIGSLVMVAFQLIQNSGKTSERVVTQEEMNFVLKKIDWILTGATNISITSAKEIIVTNPNISVSGIKIEYDDINNKITLDDEDITTINVHVDDLVFTSIGSSPVGVQTTLTIDGQTATLSKYLRI